MKAHRISSLERLECRIAPATLVNPTTLTYTDVDGDLVTVKISKGAFTDPAGGNVDDFTLAPSGLGEQLQRISLGDDGATFDGANLIVTAARTARGGDGFANLGRIAAAGIDLGRVKIAGDLGAIDVGDATTSDGGLASLTVQSLGRFGLSTQGGAGNLVSSIEGRLGALAVKSDIVAARVSVSGGLTPSDGTIGPITIGGSVIGTGAESGRIVSTGDMGTVKIGRDLRGVFGVSSGTLRSEGKMGAVTIGGNVIGSSASSGGISSLGDMGVVKIAGDLRGGAGDESGSILSSGKLAGVTIGGSVFGGGGESSGVVRAMLDMGAVKIGGDIIGSGDFSGGIVAGGKLASVTLGGSLRGGDGRSSGNIEAVGKTGAIRIGEHIAGGAGGDSGQIEGGGGIVSVTLGGSLLAGSAATSGAILCTGDLGVVKIAGNIVGGGDSAGRIATLGAGSDIGRITVGGSLFGGSGSGSGAIFSAGVLGAVVVAGDVVGGGAGAVDSGKISGNVLSDVTISGSLLGGSASGSGSIASPGNIGAVKILGDVRGGTGDYSGEVRSFPGSIRSVIIGGSLVGGSNVESGSILSVGDLPLVKINGNVRGGSGEDSGRIASTAGRLGSVTIGGAISSGTGDSSGSIRAGEDIGALTIQGNATGTSFDPLIISAGGQATPGRTGDIAIGAVTIGGRAERVKILAGYGIGSTGIGGDGGENADAQITKIRVAGDWIASSAAAGVTDGADGFGNANDARLLGIGVSNDAGRVSKIGAIAITGQVLGVVGGAEHFGFVAQQIGTFKTGSAIIATSAGTNNDVHEVGATGNVTIREVAV